MEEAKQLLESILAMAPFHSQTLWTLGLVEVTTGNPITGLRHWEKLNPEDFPQLTEKRELVLAHLSYYEKVRSMYNNALALAKEKKFEEANQVLSSISNQKLAIPLPLDFYKLSLLVKISLGEISLAKEFVTVSPEYIQTSPTILSFMDKMKVEQVEKVVPMTEKGLPKKKNKVHISLLSAGVLVIAVAGSIYLFNSKSVHSPDKEKKPAVATTNQEDPATKVKLSQLETLVTTLQADNSKLESEKNKLSEEQKQKLAADETLAKAGINLDPIKIEKAREVFNKGLKNYNHKNWELAVEQFQLSLSLVSDQYFSDDATYFLAQSKFELNELNPDDPVFQQFENSQDDNFKESTCRDAMMLLQAKTYYQAGIKIIANIKDQYPNEWTSSAANSLEKTILQGS